MLSDAIGRVVGRYAWNDLHPDGAAHLAPALSLMTGMTSLKYVVCVVWLSKEVLMVWAELFEWCQSPFAVLTDVMGCVVLQIVFKLPWSRWCGAPGTSPVTDDWHDVA